MSLVKEDERIWIPAPRAFKGFQRNGFTTALLRRSDALALINDRYIHISLVQIELDILVPKVRYFSTRKRLNRSVA
jgi:hypothetical protein